MRKWNNDDLFYVCSMIEFVARETHNKTKDIVAKLSDKELAHQLKAAGVNHCLSFEQVCDEWIEEYGIEEGTFDNISTCKYNVPTVLSIGRVYQTLILNVMELYEDVIEAIKKVYSSFISEEISNFNSNVYYSNPDYIKCSYEAGMLLVWKQRKLGDMVIIERGGSPRPIDKFITEDKNGLNWVKIGDAPEQGNYITRTKEKIKTEGLSKTREVHPGDLILSNSMSFGRPYIMAIDGCIHDGWLLIRDHEKKFDLKYLCCMLGTDMMLFQYKQMAAGSTVNNLNKELVGNTVVKYPSPAEQSKIGVYFSTLDGIITLHKKKCDELRNIKKFMLQNMFI